MKKLAVIVFASCCNCAERLNAPNQLWTSLQIISALEYFPEISVDRITDKVLYWWPSVINARLKSQKAETCKVPEAKIYQRGEMDGTGNVTNRQRTECDISLKASNFSSVSTAFTDWPLLSQPWGFEDNQWIHRFQPALVILV